MHHIGLNRVRLLCDPAWPLAKIIKSCFWAYKRRPSFQKIAGDLSALIAEHRSNDLGVDVPQCHDALCPITMNVMREPVMCADGHSYERAAIKNWLATNNTSPITGLPLDSKRLVDNITLRKMIDTLSLCSSSRRGS